MLRLKVKGKVCQNITLSGNDKFQLCPLAQRRRDYNSTWGNSLLLLCLFRILLIGIEINFNITALIDLRLFSRAVIPLKVRVKMVIIS